MVKINQKYKPLLFGLGLVLAVGLIELALFYSCKNSLLCVVLLSIPLLPGALLNLEGYVSIFVSIIFWFLIGSLIGFLVYKVKKS